MLYFTWRCPISNNTLWVYMQKVELRYWWEYGDEKTRINKLNDSWTVG